MPVLIAHHAERIPITKPAASISLTNPRGNGSPTSISIILAPSNPVCITTIRAGSSRTSPVIEVSSLLRDTPERYRPLTRQW